jgi:hypothetical protein
MPSDVTRSSSVKVEVCARSRTAYAIAVAIGLGSLVAIYGPGFVFGTSGYWELPTIDHRMYMMGYRYFLFEPWHWPLFDVHANLPGTKSIAFSDTPLLWAMLNKGLAAIVPLWRDYSARAFLGLWYAVASTLQAVLGVAILRALGHRSLRAAVVGALFAIAIPAWTFRFPHASLYGHFVLLWALYLYLRPCRGLQIAQLGIAAWINAYLTVMSLAVFVASMAHREPGCEAAAKERRAEATMTPGRRALWLVLGGGVVIGALALAGYFAPEAATSVSGFPDAGCNLLGPVMPLDSGFVGGALWSDSPSLSYEGVCYFGIGVIVLAATTLRGDAIATARRHAALAAICATTALFAISNHIHAGSLRIASYPIPHVLHWIPDQFRCPGRFSWLPMYVVVFFVLSRALRATGWKRAMLPVLAIAQLVDVSPDWKRWQGVTDGPPPSGIDVAAWRRLIAASAEIRVFPAHDCNSDRSFELATQIEYLASETATPINGVYTARPARDCDAEVAAALALRPEPRTLYVFLAPMLGLGKRLAAGGLPCAEFAAGEVCATDRALIDSLGWPATPPPAPLAFGGSIDLADPAATHLELGWASAEADGRWTDGAVARVVFRPTGAPPARPRIRVDGEALLCGERTGLDVDVAIGGERVGTLHFPSRSAALELPADLLRPIVELDLRPRDFRSPHELGCRRTVREIALKVRRIWIE